MDILVIGPLVDHISGSLLRPMNILYSLKGLNSLRVSYIPIKSVANLLPQLGSLLSADILIVSGVNPWVSALLVLLRRFIRKTTIVDVHGFAWYEAYITKGSGTVRRVLLLISEALAYSFANHVIVASKWLANALKTYFKVRNVFVVENATSVLFERIARRLSNIPANKLRRFVLCNILGLRAENKLILVAPLPGVFASNLLAHKYLLNLLNKLPENVLVAITGMKGDVHNDRLVYVGYLSYPKYVALLLASDAIVLPYPPNAICGGARNKVLEAGYCGKPIISTGIGMLHIPVRPKTHYIPLNELMDTGIKWEDSLWREVAARLKELIINHYSFQAFKRAFLQRILTCTKSFTS